MIVESKKLRRCAVSEPDRHIVGAMPRQDEGIDAVPDNPSLPQRPIRTTIHLSGWKERRSLFKKWSSERRRS
jgi:hypothetical protein